MLDTLRKKKNSIFGFVIIGFCSLLMVPFGLDMIRTGGADTDSVRVDDMSFTMKDYYRRLNRWQNVFRQQLGQNYEMAKGQLNIEQRVVDEIVNGALLDKLTESLGLAASMSQIKNQIASHPFFQGELTKANYETFLQVQGLSGVGLEQQTAKEIIGRQLTSILSDLNTPTDAELKSIYLDSERTASFRVLKFQPSAFAAEVNKEDEEALKAYFTDNAELYRKPRAVRYAFIPFKASDFQPKVDVTEDDIIEQYESEKHNLFEAPQVRLRKLVLNKAPAETSSALEEIVTGDATTESAAQKDANKAIKERAEELRARLDSGDDFAALAKEFSEDAETKSSGGDIGWVRYNVLENTVRQVASAKAVGEHSEVIDSPDSFQLVYVEEKKERRQKTLDEVRGVIKAKLQIDYAPEYGGAAAEEVYQLVEKNREPSSEDLSKLAGEKGYEVVTTEGFLSRIAASTKYPRALTAKALELSAGDTETLSLGDDSYVLRILEVKDSYIPEFEEVKTQITSDYVLKQSSVLADKKANEILEKYIASKDSEAPLTLDKLAAEAKMTIEVSESAKRAETSTAPLNAPNVKQSAFTLTESSPFAAEVFQVGSDLFLIELASSTLPKDEEFEKNIDQLKAKEETAAGSRLTGALISRLRSESEIWVNPEIFASPS